MKFYTAPVNQGQIVTVSYGWDGGVLYRRTEDASDRSMVVRRLSDPWDEADTPAKVEELEAWDAWNDDPPSWLDAALDDAPIEAEHIALPESA